MKVIKPVEITDARLVTSSLNPVSAPAWNASTTYVKGDRSQVGSRIYQSLQAGNVGKDPTQSSNSLWWIDAGPTNRWAMFDQEINTQSVATAPGGLGPVEISVTVAPGMCNSIAVLEMVGNEVEVRVMDGTYTGAQQVYHQVINLDNTLIFDWYSYFFEPPTRLTEITLQDLPPYGSAQVTVTVRGSGQVGLGSLIVGTTYTLGDLNYGARMGINDYSKKSTNDFGAVTIVKRNFSKRADVPLTFDTENLERVYRLLTDLRSTVCLWLGSEDERLSPLNILGFYKEFQIEMKINNLNYCTLSIEGMI